MWGTLDIGIGDCCKFLCLLSKLIAFHLTTNPKKDIFNMSLHQTLIIMVTTPTHMSEEFYPTHSSLYRALVKLLFQWKGHISGTYRFNISKFRDTVEIVFEGYALEVCLPACNVQIFHRSFYSKRDIGTYMSLFPNLIFWGSGREAHNWTWNIIGISAPLDSSSKKLKTLLMKYSSIQI